MSPLTSAALRSGALAVALATLLGGCAPLLMGGAVVGGALVATDRRTSGTMLEDETIEFKARNRLDGALGDRGRVKATSYNRMLLLTGNVPDEADKLKAQQAVATIENVQSVANELVVGFSRSFVGRSRDAFITSKVKASFVDAKDLFANSVKVVTADQTVYLMGRVSEREATRASEIARGVEGVQKVVRIFEVISEAELANTLPKAAPVKR